LDFQQTSFITEYNVKFSQRHLRRTPVSSYAVTIQGSNGSTHPLTISQVGSERDGCYRGLHGIADFVSLSLSRIVFGL
jgi:hypothetical protein